MPASPHCIQPFWPELLLGVGALALTTLAGYYYYGGSGSGSQKKLQRDKNAVMKEVHDYYESNGGLKPIDMGKRVLCQFGNKLTVSYEPKDCVLRIGEIERPKGVKFFASDILAYVVARIAETLKQDRLEIKKIHGGAIVNKGTQLLANLPGAKFVSEWASGLAVKAAPWTPLGKMTEHFLEEHYPGLAMKGLTLEKGPQSNAPNVSLALGKK